jgi:hypothetical protein
MATRAPRSRAIAHNGWEIIDQIVRHINDLCAVSAADGKRVGLRGMAG